MVLVDSLLDRYNGRQGNVVEVEVGIAGRRVIAMVFETVKVLVALAADLASIRLFLLHPDGARVRD